MIKVSSLTLNPIVIKCRVIECVVMKCLYTIYIASLYVVVPLRKANHKSILDCVLQNLWTMSVAMAINDA